MILRAARIAAAAVLACGAAAAFVIGPWYGDRMGGAPTLDGSGLLVLVALFGVAGYLLLRGVNR